MTRDAASAVTRSLSSVLAGRLIRKGSRAHRIAPRRFISPEEFGDVVEIDLGRGGGVGSEVSEGGAVGVSIPAPQRS
jgi:hypothetical protein